MLEHLIPIGTLIILIGIMIVIVGIILFARPKGTEGGVVIWIGPVPIIGATSKRMFYAMLIASAVLIILLFFYKKIFI